MTGKEYKMEIDPRILELLGPNLYTNIYYVLAELIANAYDADARNVYVIVNSGDITIEDDGHGMSYNNGDVANFLHIANVSRTDESNSYTRELKRRKMGRKGVGKLAALSVSENVRVKTIKGGEKSGFVLSRHPSGEFLQPLADEEIFFQKVTGSGTAIVMESPQYSLHKSLEVIRKNLVKIFPLVGNGFSIHVIRGRDELIIDSTDETYASQLCAIISLGDVYKNLANKVPNKYPEIREMLVDTRPAYSEPIILCDRQGEEHEYVLRIEGWIGAYESVRGRKSDVSDFPENFISIYANKKMGEFNVLPSVGQNKLNEVYVVGQIHIDLFEKSELPDMALSNRQGYKSDDPRYQAALKYIREQLLSPILEMRNKWADAKNKEKKIIATKTQEKVEAELRKAVVSFKQQTTEQVLSSLKDRGNSNMLSDEDIRTSIESAIEKNAPVLGIKSKADSQKKKILISHTKKDCPLADIIYSMLIYNNVPSEAIIYTNSEHQECRIPENMPVYDYLKKFFVDSYSDKKMYVLFVTSEHSEKSWGALIEVGAAWITSVDSKIFNIPPGHPGHPLNDEVTWHTTTRDADSNQLSMDRVNWDIFCQKIEDVCDKLGYAKKSREDNRRYLSTLVAIS